MSYIWSLLADCYYQLGKHSASLRACNNANDTLYYIPSSSLLLQREEQNQESLSHLTQLPSFVLCSWGQVLLDLGLFTDACEKFNQVLLQSLDDDDCYHPIAAYLNLMATCLLYICKYNIDQGKYNSFRIFN